LSRPRAQGVQARQREDPSQDVRGGVHLGSKADLNARSVEGPPRATSRPRLATTTDTVNFTVHVLLFDPFRGPFSACLGQQLHLLKDNGYHKRGRVALYFGRRLRKGFSAFNYS